MHILINGMIMKEDEAKISPFDHGYMYGLGVFETLRVYNGHPFLFTDHMVRLKRGLEDLNIHWEITDHEVLEMLRQLLHVNQLDNAYVRINVSAGKGSLGLQVDKYTQPTLIMYMKPLPENDKKIEKEAILLKVKRNTPEGIERLKSHHFLNNVLGKREVGGNPEVEGIFLNNDGLITEGVVSNIFWLKQHMIYTPSIDTGILNGITRQFVLAFSKKLGYELQIGHFNLEDLLSCDEAFVTNSIQEIVPLKKIDKKEMPGLQGTHTAKLIDWYNQFKYTLWTKTEIPERVF